MDDTQKQIVPSENGSSDEGIQQPSRQPEALLLNDEFKQVHEEAVPEIPSAIYDNAELQINAEFKQVEQERLEQMRKTFPEVDKFPIFGF